MRKGLSVSALDLVGMHPNEKPGAAIARSVGLAQHVERLGYKRYSERVIELPAHTIFRSRTEVGDQLVIDRYEARKIPKPSEFEIVSRPVRQERKQEQHVRRHLGLEAYEKSLKDIPTL